MTTRTTHIDKDHKIVSLDTAKLHLRVGDDDQNDALIALKIDMAISIAERETDRHIQQKTLEVRSITRSGIVPLPVYCRAVTSVQCQGQPVEATAYEAIATDEQTTLYFVDPKYWGKPLQITLEVGYDEATCPPAIAAAVLLILGTIYDNESDNVVGRQVSQLSITAARLLARWRILPY